MAKGTIVVLNTLQHRSGNCAHSLSALSLGAYSRSKRALASMLDLRFLSHPPGCTPESIASAVLEHKPTLCGFTVTSLTEPVIGETVRLIKNSRPSTTVVLGGPAIVQTPAESRLGDSGADLVVNGEGEVCLSEILQACSQGAIEEVLGGRRSIPGVYLGTSRLVHLAPHPLLDTRLLRSPYADTEGGSLYDDIGGSPHHVYWETSRGCVFRCSYCAYTHQRPVFRPLPHQRLEREVDYFSRLGIRSIFITDPILGGPKHNTKQVLRMISRIASRPSVAVLLRPEYLDAEMVELLAAANVSWLDLGLQTTNPTLDSLNRRHDLSDFLARCHLLRAAGMRFNLDLIVGLPGDSPEDMRESMRFVIEDARPASLKVFPLRIYPGTAIHDRALVSPASWLAWDPVTRLVLSTESCTANEMRYMVRLGNMVVWFYRFLENRQWLGQERRLRSLATFDAVLQSMETMEFADAAVWRILNCPQNSYDENVAEKVWYLCAVGKPPIDS